MTFKLFRIIRISTFRRGEFRDPYFSDPVQVEDDYRRLRRADRNSPRRQ
jgi:hypothetical protein